MEKQEALEPQCLITFIAVPLFSYNYFFASILMGARISPFSVLLYSKSFVWNQTVFCIEQLMLAKECNMFDSSLHNLKQRKTAILSHPLWQWTKATLMCAFFLLATYQVKGELSFSLTLFPSLPPSPSSFCLSLSLSCSLSLSLSRLSEQNVPFV